MTNSKRTAKTSDAAVLTDYDAVKVSVRERYYAKLRTGLLFYFALLRRECTQTDVFKFTSKT